MTSRALPLVTRSAFVLPFALATMVASATIGLAPASAGPTSAGTTTATSTPVHVVGLDGVTTLEVWPALDPATNAPYLAGAERPAILVIPGWSCTPANYQDVGQFLSSRGYVCAVLDHEGNTDELPDTWVVYAETALDTLVAETASPVSPLFHEIDATKLGVVGHSLGGATATLVASSDPRVQALVLCGPQSGDTTFLTAAYAIHAPLLTIDGSLDRLAPYAQCSEVVVGHVASADKASVVIEGGNHTNCPADFDDNYQRGPGSWVLQSTGSWPFVTWVYDWPIIPGLTPIPGAQQRATAYPYLGAWFDRFLCGAKDPGGWTNGKAADQQVQSKVLASDFFNAAARKGP